MYFFPLPQGHGSLRPVLGASRTTGLAWDADSAAFIAAYPSAGPLAAGEFNPTALDNAGESLVLYAASGLEVFRFFAAHLELPPE